VAIGAAAVVTAGHCARRAVVIAAGRRIAVVRATRSAVLDGRRVSVSGDAAILLLRAPLPPGISPLPVGEPGAEGAMLIAGFGTADERQRGAVGTLRQARVVPAGRRLLVDPARGGTISASACYGDSGGAVLAGGMLVGVITRATYPRAKVACGWYTEYAPVRASGPAIISVAVAAPLNAEPPSASQHPVAAPAPVSAPAADVVAPEPRKKVRYKKRKKKRYRLSRRP
jgi:hypothetical protein